MWRILVLVGVVGLVAGCRRELNPEFCLAHPEDVRCAVDAPPPCASNADCPDDQVCDLTAPAHCALCSAADTSRCSPTEPVCNDGRCEACQADRDCAGDVCMPDGSCPSAESIIYAAPNGVMMAGCGSRAMPCSIVQAVAEASAERAVIKLIPDAAADYTVAGSTGLTVDKNVTIVARGARIRKTSSGPAVTVGAGRSVTFLGGEITGGMGGSGDGILCTTGVLTAIGTDIGGNARAAITDVGCGLVLEDAQIHNNVVGITKTGGTLGVTRSTFKVNTTGGIVVNGDGIKFTIVGNVFWMNGTPATTAGAVFLATDTSTTSRLEFNSFNGNQANTVTGAAIHCTVNGFVARGNAMFENGSGPPVGGTAGSACTHVFSLTGPGTPLNGTGNVAMDPMFVSAATGDLHTMAGSPTENAGDPASDLTGPAAVDIDGDRRTAPADIGADQH